MNKLHSEDSPSRRTRFRKLGSVAACLLIAFRVAPPAFANGCLLYQTTTFSLPGSAYPTSINSSSTVAGVYQFPGGGFVRDPDGTITTFKSPGGNIISPVYMNDSGVVAGSYQNTTLMSLPHGFVGNPNVAGGLVSFDPPGSVGTYVRGINASGWVSGFFSDASGYRHGFLYIGGKSLTIDFPGAEHTFGEGITPQGAVVGTYIDNQMIQHGFLCLHNFSCLSFEHPPSLEFLDGLVANSSGTVAGTLHVPNFQTTFREGYVGNPISGIFATFQYPGALQDTEAFGINASGEIVGSYLDTNSINHAFLREPNGAISNVDPPGYLSSAGATAINDSGAFTGFTGALGFVTKPYVPWWCRLPQL